MGSTFLLYAAGLGRAESAATASAINWIVKDGIGQAGTLVTARMFSHDFDLNTRSWYIFANVLACLAAVAEVCSLSLSVTLAQICFTQPKKFATADHDQQLPSGMVYPNCKCG